MQPALIPFRSYHFTMPQPAVMKVLRIIHDNEIDFFIESVTDDEKHLTLSPSVNLGKGYQRSAVTQIEGLLAISAQP